MCETLAKNKKNNEIVMWCIQMVCYQALNKFNFKYMFYHKGKIS